MYTTEELRKLADKEMRQELEKAQFELLKIKLAVQSKQEKNTAKLQNMRTYVARIKTIKREMEMEAAPENPKSTVTK